MALSMHDRASAEPSSDFPTEDDVGPCAMFTRPKALACALGCAAVLGLIAFLIGRAIGRQRELG